MKTRDLIWIAAGAVALYYGYAYWKNKKETKK
jgi:hypothetical protein